MKTSLTIISKEVSPIVEKAETLKIVDIKSMEVASDFRLKLKAEEKRLKEDKEKITKPINESLKEIRSKYAPAEDIIERALDFLNKKMSDYQLALIIKQREEEKKIADRIGEGKGKLKLETAVKQISQLDVIESPTSTKFRMDMVLEIINKEEIPFVYLNVDESALTKALKAGIVIKGAKLVEKLTPINNVTRK